MGCPCRQGRTRSRYVAAPSGTYHGLAAVSPPAVELVAYDDDGRPYVARLLVVGLAVLAAAVGVAIVLIIDAARSTSGSDSPRPDVAATTTADAQRCSALRARADAVVVDARALEAALATQTRVMNDLLAHRTTLDKALAEALPALTKGSQQSLQFDQDTSAYRAAATRCST